MNYNYGMEKEYFVYMVRCEDSSIYTGITTDVVRRMQEHLGLRPNGAKYTKRSRPVELSGLWRVEGRAAASRFEFRVKQLSRTQKENLIAHPRSAYALVSLDEKPRCTMPATRERLWSEAMAIRRD